MKPGTTTVVGKPSETLRPMTEKSILRQAGVGRTQQ
ncbi:MAG: type II toxin-antitoxin system HicA family toxin [Pseudonocardiaceae bacterium]